MIHAGYIADPDWLVADGLVAEFVGRRDWGLIRLMGTSINWTYSTVLIQTEVPDRFLGRVFALDLGLFTLATSIATYLTGYTLDQANASICMVLASIWLLGSLLPIILWGIYRAIGSNRPDSSKT